MESRGDLESSSFQDLVFLLKVLAGNMALRDVEICFAGKCRLKKYAESSTIAKFFSLPFVSI